MSDNLMEKVNALGERLKITGTEVSKQMAAANKNSWSVNWIDFSHFKHVVYKVKT